MVSEIHLVGDVVGKQRPRFSRGKVTRVYTPSSTVAFEKRVRNAYIQAGNGKHRGAVAVIVAYKRPLPKSRPKRVQVEQDVYKPDLDNVVKSVLDALNGVAFDDDKQVTMLTARKLLRERAEAEELHVVVLDMTEELEKAGELQWLHFTR